MSKMNSSIWEGVIDSIPEIPDPLTRLNFTEINSQVVDYANYAAEDVISPVARMGPECSPGERASTD